MRILDDWQELAEDAESMRAWSERTMIYRFFQGAITSEALEWFRTLQDRTDPILVREVARPVKNTDLTPLLRELAPPTLLIALGFSHASASAELFLPFASALPRE